MKCLAKIVTTFILQRIPAGADEVPVVLGPPAP
jgi:hypothetical protein